MLDDLGRRKRGLVLRAKRKVGGRNGIHLPIPTGPLPAEVTIVMANSKTKWNPDSRIFVKVVVYLSPNARNF